VRARTRWDIRRSSTVPGRLITVGGPAGHDHALTVAGGAITVIRTLTHPDRLVQVVPSWVA